VLILIQKLSNSILNSGLSFTSISFKTHLQTNGNSLQKKTLIFKLLENPWVAKLKRVLGLKVMCQGIKCNITW
jgi:hypothetical protein